MSHRSTTLSTTIALHFFVTNTVYFTYWIILTLHICLAQSQGDTYTYCLCTPAIHFSLFFFVWKDVLVSYSALYISEIFLIMEGLCLPSAHSILLCLTLPAFLALFSFLYLYSLPVLFTKHSNALKGCCIYQVSLGHSNISYCEVFLLQYQAI